MAFDHVPGLAIGLLEKVLPSTDDVCLFVECQYKATT